MFIQYKITTNLRVYTYNLKKNVGDQSKIDL